ncbi:type II secretion system F family protein [bacterium]|nr:type II secretion system F family protein [bacterium]
MEKKLSYEELDQLAQELASFARTDIPMPEGLRQLSSSLDSARLRQLAGEMAEALEQGKPLSQALEESSFSVPSHYVAVLQCAEVSGDAPTLLQFAVDHARRLKRYRTTMLTATLYPMIVVFVMSLVLIFLANYIVPKFYVMYSQLGAELPSLTKLVLMCENVLAGIPGFVLVGLIAALSVSMLFAQRVQDRVFDLVAGVPGFTSLTVLSDTAVVMRYLNVMMTRSIPAPTALRAAALAVTRKSTRTSLERMATAGERGHQLSSTIGDEFPSTVAYLFTKAEERGDLPESCDGIASYCEDRFDRLSSRALSLFEPILIFLVAVFVGILVVGLYIPLFSFPRVVH